MRTRITTTAALVTAFGLGLAGCSSSGQEGDGSGKVTLTLATFNEFGYEDLIKEYMAAHPNVTIEHKKAATSNAVSYTHLDVYKRQVGHAEFGVPAEAVEDIQRAGDRPKRVRAGRVRAGCVRAGRLGRDRGERHGDSFTDNPQVGVIPVLTGPCPLLPGHSPIAASRSRHVSR